MGINQAFLVAAFTVTTALFLSCGGEKEAPVPVEPVRITMTSGQVGPELEHLQGLLERFNRENPGITAELKDFSSVPQQQLGSINQILLSQSPELDVIPVDVIWPGDLASHLVDLKEYDLGDSLGDFFPAALENNTVEGRLVAVPWFLDAGLLYYRKDLLDKYGKAVPRTWDELASTARYIQTQERKAGNPEFWGFVWPAGPGEGLTCTTLELIASNGGGKLVESDGRVNLDNPRAVEILEKAKSWIGDITPLEALGFNSSEATRTWWQTGNVLFMRNWPYAYAAGNRDDSPVKGLFRVAPLPAGASGKGASTLGGWQLGVSKYSRYKDQAVRLVKFLTSREIQKFRAETAGYYPTLRSLYADGSLEKSGNPIFGQLLDVLDVTVPRPSTLASPVYNNFSQILFNHVLEILSGKTSAVQGLKNAQGALTAVLEAREKK